ncbi:MAG TPA: hypothetical protein VF667_04580 [Pseudonocardia sp.]
MDDGGTVVRRQVEVPGSAVLALAGGVAWLVGSSALPAGPATVVLAAGLTLTVWLVVRAARTGARGPELDRAGRRRVLQLLVLGVALVVVGGVLLRSGGRGELTVPLATALIGALVLPLASLLDRRGLLLVGGGLMVLGAAGAVLALNSPGRTESQGLVGFAGGLLLWAAAAHGAGLLGELRGRVRR